MLAGLGPKCRKHSHHSTAGLVILRGTVSVGCWKGTVLTAMLSAAALALGACGDSGDNSGASATTAGGSAASSRLAGNASSADSADVVAHVGRTAVTRAQVSHWMTAMAGHFYFNLSHGQLLPDGLASDPPAYARCVSSLEATAAAAPKKVAGVTGVVMLRKCRQLYRALKAQATEQLVRALWLGAVAGEEGVNVSDPEVLAAYQRYNRESYASPAEARQHLTNTRRSDADELVVIREELLSDKLLQKAGAGGPNAQARFSQTQKRWTAKTTCRPGYVVQYCSQFTEEPPPSSASPPVTVLMEQVATLATGSCINTAACSKQ
jgi:hypothetical protein